MSPEPPAISVEDLRTIGHDHGLDAVGVARAEVFASTRSDLVERKAAGLHATMQFTYRNPERSTDPARALPGARSLVVAARSYRRDPAGAAAVDQPHGAVARYAWEDHYRELRVGLGAIAAALDAGGHATRVLADDNALVDREAAYRAGLGWYGKNANLLLPGQGSWFVLGSVLTDADLQAAEPVPDGCGTCSQCISGCPTGAIVAPGVVDARRCLAWLVQAEGAFPEQYREALGGRIYGCDDCQEVCPPNKAAARRPAPASDPRQRPQVALVDMLAADDDALLRDYGQWYIPRRDPRYLRRNALIALGNVADPGDLAVRAALGAHRDGDDPMLAEHADWALQRLDRR